MYLTACHRMRILEVSAMRVRRQLYTIHSPFTALVVAAHSAILPHSQPTSCAALCVTTVADGEPLEMPQGRPSIFSAVTPTVSRYTVLLNPSIRVCCPSQMVSLNDNFPASKQSTSTFNPPVLYHWMAFSETPAPSFGFFPIPMYSTHRPLNA